ncbi:hypothetical protein GH714_009446 [Hevea brasiliensis]|uniref:Retrovirus-related Pol polyprotein from transposon TNT 1-94-like beta-barrel domain-containing protein n=1 Tax=Hevea brasiliensis TaxID=3981 RepID=A0A6A6KZ51_HEVBR|nr:hypothetical protein GH714_009446 [Hevea brasiliensis]
MEDQVRVKLSKANVVRDKEDGDQLKWEQCFTVEVAEGRDNVTVESTQVQALFNHEIYRDEWIIDSGCSHHVTGNDSLLSKVRQHKGERVIVTTNNSAYPVAKEGVVKIGMDDKSMVKLNDVFHVPEKGGGVWIQNKEVCNFRDVVFDEVSSYYSVQKTTIQEVTLDGDQENLQLCLENNMEVPIDDEFPASNISNSKMVNKGGLQGREDSQVISKTMRCKSINALLHHASSLEQ